MISRVADHCFWFGRYLERAESTARVLQVTAALAIDSDLTPQQCWLPVVVIAGERERFAAELGEEALGDGEAVQDYLVFGKAPVSLARSIAAARENARSIRETISLEVFESINELHLWMQSPAARAGYEEHRYGFYRHVRRETQLGLGLLRGTMLHDAPLDFIWLGVMLERTGQTARILDVHHHAFSTAANGDAEAHPVVEVSLWLSLLRACYGFESFMKSQRGAVTGPAVSSFLIWEPRFPRSVRHCLQRARERLAQIRPEEGRLPALRAQERLRALEAWLEGRAAKALEDEEMHQTLTKVVEEVDAACDEIAVELLAAAPPSQTQSESQNGQSQSQAISGAAPGRNE
ncbi:MAG TPA: alpha-E domain-containing protein [Myxococcales bacterium]|nr:alpha-E domain-containing protein [Myxococcales bacterium]